MSIENFQPGDAITVLNGRKHHCPAGCCVIAEAYEDCKGRPLFILAIDPPYIVTAHVAGPGGRVLDSRCCEMTKCSGEYVTAFRQMVSKTQQATS